MLELLTLKPEAFGLDISDLSLKIIKLKKRGKFLLNRGAITRSGATGLCLASFGESVIKPGIIEKGEIKNEEALAKIIKRAVTEVKGETINSKYAIASLPEEKAFLQVIQLPIMKEEETKKAVYFEAENYVPMPVGKVYLDSQIIPPVVDHLDHLDVLIAALPQKTVNPYASCLKKAGLIPKVLEIESLAVARAIVKNESSPSPVFLIDLGATRTSFIIFSGHSLRFTSSVQISSQLFTEAISKTLKIDLKSAEKLKLKYGIQADKKSKKVFKALAPALADLVKQIKKYFNYYQTHASHEHLSIDGKGVRKIFLCGGGANLKGLTDFLSLELKIPTELANPWINILPEPLKEVPELPYEESLRYTTALGLALRGSREN